MLTMMALGRFRFGLTTMAYQTASRSWSFEHATLSRLRNQSVSHFTGIAPQKISLAGVIYPKFRGGLRQLEAMAEEAARGAPLHMVDGTGRPWGDVVILSLDERQSYFERDGTPQKIDFTIGLQSYG
ncbi:phage tail protein [Pseudovibrio brasiliensis]|uniref:Phage tail protein n=1 Tax=Pseudovibrio brasiliensis TaxID=1898042 RepID=A0ABX8AVY0_9HYPH|nr:phage tail protein [Pseudovibrio brasiliensis]QUS59193.1 phage tail protein [Pseudovibrio brasiliensis]